MFEICYTKELANGSSLKSKFPDSQHSQRLEPPAINKINSNLGEYTSTESTLSQFIQQQQHKTDDEQLHGLSIQQQQLGGLTATTRMASLVGSISTKSFPVKNNSYSKYVLTFQ